MTEIKICGMTNIEDAVHASECGAHALGFVFFPGSPRCVTPEMAREIIKALPPEIATVGVFVNRDFREVRWIADFCGLDLLQFHGDEPPDYCRHFPPSMLIKALSPAMEADEEKLRLYPVKAILADARDGKQYGGTGKTTDWALAKKIASVLPLVLAGGLKEENIVEAIETVSPDAVDVNSGVEIFPGKKDPEKVKRVIGLVRSIDRQGKAGIFRK